LKLEPVATVRKVFKDTAAWFPDLKTDKRGIAIAMIKLPDNLTTWRATVRGVTTGTDVGSAVNKVISTQDLIVRLSLPRFFSLGDDTYVNAVVHNYTDREQPIHLSLDISPQFAVRKQLKQELVVGADKAKRFSWPITVIGSGTGSVTVKAIGKTAADAMETKINILPLGVKAFMIKSGQLLDDPSAATINVDKSMFVPVHTNIT
jgi:alpha-2-macroglobulin